MSSEPIISEDLLRKYSTQDLVDLAAAVLKIINERRASKSVREANQ